MTSRRSNRRNVPPAKPVCILCARDPGYKDMGRVPFAGSFVCITCALKILDGLLKVWEAPEITQAQRIRYEQEHRVGPKRSNPEPKEPGWVYYIRMDNLIKIGYSKDVAQRMRAYPPGAELLAAHPGTLELEKHVQTRFAGTRARGREWFNPSGELMEHIESVVEQFGDASHMAYKYTKPKSPEDRVRDMFKPPRSSRNVPGASHVA